MRRSREIRLHEEAKMEALTPDFSSWIELALDRRPELPAKTAAMDILLVSLTLDETSLEMTSARDDKVPRVQKC